WTSWISLPRSVTWRVPARARSTAGRSCSTRLRRWRSRSATRGRRSSGRLLGERRDGTFENREAVAELAQRGEHDVVKPCAVAQLLGRPEDGEVRHGERSGDAAL